MIVDAAALHRPRPRSPTRTASTRSTDLPPGDYLVTFYYADITVERTRRPRRSREDDAGVPEARQTKAAGGETIHDRRTRRRRSIRRRRHRASRSTRTTSRTSRCRAARSSRRSARRRFAGRRRGRHVRRLSSLENQYYVDGVNTTGLRTARPASNAPPPPPVRQGDAKLHGIASKVIQSKKDVVIETHGPRAADAKQARRGRAQQARRRRRARGAHPRRAEGRARPRATRCACSRSRPAARTRPTAPPIARTRRCPTRRSARATSWPSMPMNVSAGTSAMVAMVHGETTGGVVYLYDPISERGDERFAFKAVRLDNPTNDTLEPGPVTVYGDGRFIGEGITEPVPPKRLGRRAVRARSPDRRRAARTTRRTRSRSSRPRSAASCTAEVQHRRSTRFTITSRLHEPTKVYLRHRLGSGLEARRRAVELHEGRRLAAVRGRPRCRRDQVRDDRRGHAGRAHARARHRRRRSTC